MPRGLTALILFASFVVAGESPSYADGRHAARAKVGRMFRQYEREGPHAPQARRIAQGYGTIGRRPGQSIAEMKRAFLAVDKGAGALLTDIHDGVAVYAARRGALVRINQRIAGQSGATPSARAVRARITILEKQRATTPTAPTQGVWLPELKTAE